MGVSSGFVSGTNMTVVDLGADFAIPFGRQGNGPALAGFHFLDIAHYFFVDGALRRHHHHRHLLINQGNGAVLHLAGRVALGVDIGYFFQLQRPFKSDRIVDPAAEIEKIVRIGILLRDPSMSAVQGQHLFHQTRQAHQVLNQPG